MKASFLSISTGILALFLMGCNKDNPVESEIPLTSVTGAYFGQTPPELEATRFAVGEFLSNTQWFWHGSPVFSPDGTEVYFGTYQSSDEVKIFYSELTDGTWTLPAVIPFETEPGTNNPAFSRDGNTL